MARKNLARNICEVLKDKIRNGEYPPNSPLPSNAELKRKFGVSLITANRAVCELAAAGLVYRERGRGTYVSATASGNGRHFRIGLADSLDSPESPVFNAALNVRPLTLSRHLEELGHEVQYMDYETALDPQRLSAAAENLDGLIISRSYLDPVTMPNFLVLKLPLLVINGESIMEESFNQIVTDDRPGSRQAAAAAMKYDFPETVIVYENHGNGIQRRDSFRSALTELGYDPKKIREECLETPALQQGVFSYRMGRKLCGRLAGKLLYVTSDVVSFCMLEAFRDHGLEAGRDFQMLSYDNLEDYGYRPYGVPVLTSIDAPKIKMPRRAAELMIHLIEHPAEDSVILRIPTSLVIRKTAFSKE